jgi:hypothetical protein
MSERRIHRDVAVCGSGDLNLAIRLEVKVLLGKPHDSLGDL